MSIGYFAAVLLIGGPSCVVIQRFLNAFVRFNSSVDQWTFTAVVISSTLAIWYCLFKIVYHVEQIHARQ